MISEKMVKAINTQIKNELFSGYLYLSMAAWFEDQNLPGMAQWMYAQAHEEQEHALKFFHYLVERGARVELEAIDKPEIEFASALEVFEKSLAHEKLVTSMINHLYALAVEEKDYPTQVLLQWYIEEQVEEEDNVGSAVEMLKMADNKSWQLLMLDGKFGQRAAD
ncbi:MAG: ferritin [Anaerolineae bacterium]|jgi:ferritin|nr:ferritin [Anaerolineae bacterium]